MLWQVGPYRDATVGAVTHVAHSLAEPLPYLPERRPGSIRRTSHLEVLARPDGGLELTGVACQGDDTASCRATLSADLTLVLLDLVPDSAWSVGLVGRRVGRGFRAAVDQVCEPGSLRSVLLTELPVVAMLAGYGTLYSGLLPGPLSDQFIDGMPVDVCAGWSEAGSMMVHIRGQREIPTPDGPEVPADREGWHPMPDLVAGALRRQRLIERTGDEVWAMFRDTYARPDGTTSVLHEYTVKALMSDDSSDDISGDGSGGGDGDGRIVACVATPRVLPWAECPQAAASAGRLVGQRVGDLRALVRDDLVGTSTCTHLNDLLSSLFQAGRLV
jgi:hypothetical protein